MVSIPDLKIKSGRDFRLWLIPGKQRLFAWNNNLLLRYQVVKWKNKSPIEIPFTS